MQNPTIEELNQLVDIYSAGVLDYELVAQIKQSIWTFVLKILRNSDLEDEHVFAVGFQVGCIFEQRRTKKLAQRVAVSINGYPISASEERIIKDATIEQAVEALENIVEYQKDELKRYKERQNETSK